MEQQISRPQIIRHAVIHFPAHPPIFGMVDVHNAFLCMMAETAFFTLVIPKGKLYSRKHSDFFHGNCRFIHSSLTSYESGHVISTSFSIM